MKTSANGRALIEAHEGLILQAYDDANDRVVAPGGSVKGTLTIGYGHTTAAGPPRVVVGQKITQAQADAILASDLGKVEDDVNRLVKVPLSQNQFDALVSFHFNTGGLGRSSVLTRLNLRDYPGAANALLLWNRAGGQVLKGLVTRRQQERALFLKEDSPSASGPAIAAISVATIGTVVATQAPSHHIGWYILGTVVAVVITLLGYGLYESHKHVPVVKT
jgi:lysozyme